MPGHLNVVLCGGPAAMTLAIVVILFVVIDLGLVIGALAWLSEQRGIADITDMRYRQHRRRYR